MQNGNDLKCIKSFVYFYIYTAAIHDPSTNKEIKYVVKSILIILSLLNVRL